MTNIYDINNKTYVLKLSKQESKEFLLIENGTRLHCTGSELKKSKIPSGFTMKFRKYLRSKRIEEIKQIGSERVIEITFGSGDFQNFLILEFYS